MKTKSNLISKLIAAEAETERLLKAANEQTKSEIWDPHHKFLVLHLKNELLILNVLQYLITKPKIK